MGDTSELCFMADLSIRLPFELSDPEVASDGFIGLLALCLRGTGVPLDLVSLASQVKDARLAVPPSRATPSR